MLGSLVIGVIAAGIWYVRLRAVDDFKAVQYPAVTVRPGR